MKVIAAIFYETPQTTSEVKSVTLREHGFNDHIKSKSKRISHPRISSIGNAWISNLSSHYEGFSHIYYEQVDHGITSWDSSAPLIWLWNYTINHHQTLLLIVTF